jgi:hypothetical protein
MPLPGYVASATIEPCRFVKISGNYTVAQCVANDVAIGISQQGSCTPPVDGAPTAAATVGLPIQVFGDTETTLIEAGAAFAAGAELKPDATGRGIAAVANDKYSAVAQKAATAAGQLIPVLIRTGTK